MTDQYEHKFIDLSSVSPQSKFLESYPEPPLATSTLYLNTHTTTNSDGSKNYRLVGVHIVLSKDNPNGLWESFHVDRTSGSIDPQNPKVATKSLEIYCDTLEVHGEFSVPEANVSIFAHRIIWATPDAVINTSPLKWSTPKAEDSDGTNPGKNGAHGRNAGNFSVFVSEVVDSFAVEGSVTIYSDSDYKGQSKDLSVGTYDISELGIGNDSLSSLRVPKGLQVTLYENSGFQGRSKTLTGDASYIGDDFNDITSSIKVEPLKRFIANGGNGQDAGDGRDASPQDIRDLDSKTNATIQVNRGKFVVHSQVNFDPPATYYEYIIFDTELNGKPTDSRYGKQVLKKGDGWLWFDGGYGDSSDTWFGSWGKQNEWPSNGSSSIQPGKPGKAGNGGSIKTNIPMLFMNNPGRSGLKARDTKGIRPGNPTKCKRYQVHVLAPPSIFANRHNRPNTVLTIDEVDYTNNGKSHDAPEAEVSIGDSSAPSIIDKSNAWVHPLNLQKAIEYARDLFLSNSREEVQKFLAPYHESLSFIGTITAADIASRTAVDHDGQTDETTANSTIVAFAAVSGVATIQIEGNYVGTLAFEQSQDNGKNWAPLKTINTTSNQFETSTTSIGVFQSNIAGFTLVRVRCTAYTSGTANVSIIPNVQWISAQSEISTILLRLSSHLDYFGNPGGFSPFLSLSSTIKLYEDETQRALKALILSHWISEKAQISGEKSKALQESISVLNKDTQDAAKQILQTEQKIDSTINSINSLSQQLEEKADKLNALREKLLKEAEHDVTQQHQIKFAIKMCAAICQVIPVGQPVLGSVASLASVASNLIGSDDSKKPDTVSKIKESFGKCKEAYTEYKKVSKKVKEEGADSPAANPANNSPSGINNAPAANNNPPSGSNNAPAVNNPPSGNNNAPAANNPPSGNNNAPAEDKGLTEAKAKESVWATVGKGVGPALSQVSEAFNALKVPQSEVDAELKRLIAKSHEWVEIIKQIQDLNTEKSKLVADLEQSLQVLGANHARITSNASATVNMRQQVAEKNLLLDLEAISFVDQMGQRAKLRLLYSLYLMVKAYEASVLKPISVDWKFSEVTQKIGDFVQNGSQFDITSLDNWVRSLEPIFKANLDKVRDELLKDYNVNQKISTLRISCSEMQTPDILNQLNDRGYAEFNPLRYGLVLPTEEQGRISKIELSDIQFDPNHPQLPSDCNMIIRITPAKTGILRRAEGLYSIYSDNPLSWSWTYYNDTPSNIHPSEPSPISEDVLNWILGDQNIIKQKVTQPPIWSDLEIDISFTPTLETKPHITKLSFNFKVDSAPSPKDQRVLNVQSTGSLGSTRIQCSPNDLANRGDGFGQMIRIYQADQLVKLKVPSQSERSSLPHWNLLGSDWLGSNTYQLALSSTLEDSESSITTNVINENDQERLCIKQGVKEPTYLEKGQGLIIINKDHKEMLCIVIVLFDEQSVNQFELKEVEWPSGESKQLSELKTMLQPYWEIKSIPWAKTLDIIRKVLLFSDFLSFNVNEHTIAQCTLLTKPSDSLGKPVA